MRLVLGIAALALLAACRGPQYQSGFCEVWWTPLKEEREHLYLKEVKVVPRRGVRIETLTVEIKDAADSVHEKIVARPEPEHSPLSVGDMRVPKSEGMTVEILVKHDHSPEPIRIRFRASP